MIVPGVGASRAARPESVSLAQARRIAIAAQGLSSGRPKGRVGARHLARLIDRVAVLQIDSVNVLARAHLLPAFSRLGPYDTTLIDRASGRAPRRLVEYWAHEAAYVAPSTHRLLRWRMEHLAASDAALRFASTHAALIDRVLAVIEQEGAMTARAVEQRLASGGPVRPRGTWWDRSPVKLVLEHLFDVGALTPARRTAQFERVYDLPERVLPPGTPGGPAPDRAEAVRELVAISARALGIATARCLRDYFRVKQAVAGPAIAELVEAGSLVPVRVPGWSDAAYVHADAAWPRRVRAQALLAPFDPMVFERSRLESLFGMRYRIGIYTPAAQRVHGYYVLPFLMDDSMAARVDLKADRAAGVLRVRSAFAEAAAPGGRRCDRGEVAERLVTELAQLALWLGLGGVSVDHDAPGELREPVAALASRLG